ncbi:MAG TPA: cobyric acid synthase CobQ, partial [Ideonella sp.]|nr:cobyric acid synthase CobQ [Ideonella sp.]
RLSGPWQPLSGLHIDGYQIHLGETASADPTLPPAFEPTSQLGGQLGWQRGNLLALYLHGLFENPAVVHALFARSARPLAQVFDGLADLVGEHFDEGALMGLLAKG